MIGREAIQVWHSKAPWVRWEHVEQDLVISRAIVAIFSDPFMSAELAWRGGTALHKLYLGPQSRYSEDIDLVRTGFGPVKPIIEHLDNAFAWLPGRSFQQRRFGFRIRFKYESEIAPVQEMHLKVEANTFEHFSELPLEHLPFKVDNPWFSGSCNVTTYALEELIGTKLRAMFQRKKLRDLFDVEYALKNGDVDDSLILRCWRRYMSTNGHTPPTSREFVENMDGKMSMPDYIADIDSILRRDVSFDAQLAYRLVRERLIEKIDIR